MNQLVALIHVCSFFCQPSINSTGGENVQLNTTRYLKTINTFRVAVIYREGTEIITGKLGFTVVMTK